MVKCPTCSREVSEKDNFCQYCGKKIRDTCRYCWVRKKDNYNCGESNCPGCGLFRIEKLKTK